MTISYEFTVFTPTYNRAHTLHRVYDSLQAQTYRDFEWIVVDDGSTDGTSDLVKGWIIEANFPIRYFWQENAGKHVAHNRACQLANGYLMHIIDSDDALVVDTLARFHFHWHNIPVAMQAKYSGVVALCQDQFGRLVSPKFPESVFDVDGPTLRYRYRLIGEFCGCTLTEVLRSFPFPETKGVNFISESYVWDQIGRCYLTRCVNEVLRVYFRDDRRHTSLTKRPANRNARSQIPFYESALNQDNYYFWLAPDIFLRFAVLYIRFCQHANISPREQWQRMDSWRAKLLWLATFPIGLGVYLRDVSFRQ